MEIAPTLEYPNMKFPLKGANEHYDPSSRLREAFDRSGLSLRSWAQSIGLSDVKRAKAWLDDAGSMSARFVAPTCDLLGVTVEQLRYGESGLPIASPDRYSKIVERSLRQSFPDFHDESSPLEADDLKCMYLQLSAEDRIAISTIVRRLMRIHAESKVSRYFIREFLISHDSIEAERDDFASETGLLEDPLASTEA